MSELVATSLSAQQIQSFMRFTAEAALHTPPEWLRPIAATAVDLETREVIVTATNYAPTSFRHAEEKILDRTVGHDDTALFVTKEPCTYRQVTGRVPCAERIVQAKNIRQVYILDTDQNPHINGQGVEYLQRHGIETQFVSEHDLRFRQRIEWGKRDLLRSPTSAAWGDIYTSPKGSQKAIIARTILPFVVNYHRDSGGEVGSMLDIGAANGELTLGLQERAAKYVSHAALRTTVIEPNLQAFDALSRVADTVVDGDFTTWDRQHPGIAFDMILASHVAYYFDDPVRAVAKMAGHLTDTGTLCVIAADWQSGKAALVKSAGGGDMAGRVHDGSFPRLINADLLAGALRNEFAVSPVMTVPVPVTFSSTTEAKRRLAYMFDGLDVTQQDMEQSIRRNTRVRSDGSVVWNRDCAFFMVKPRPTFDSVLADRLWA